MAHRVRCAYCGKTFDRDRVEYVLVSAKRYAHKECSMSADERLQQVEKDKQSLENYIKNMFGTTYVDPRVQKQIRSYLDDYHFTYSGIEKALTYFYEVKGNDVAKANGGIGIVPYVYQKAYNYYFSLWQANQKNENKVIVEYKPVVKEIVIQNPERNVKKRPLFSFLDEEETTNG